MRRRPTPGSLFTRPLTKAFSLACSVTLVAGCNASGGGSTGPDPNLVVVTVQVTPATDTLNALGLTRQLTATAANASGGPISGKTFTWTSSDSTVATVNVSGLTTAVDNGTATITATVDGIAGAATLVVAQVPISISVTPTNDTLVALTDTLRLVLAVTDARSQTIASPSVTWASADEAIVTVDATGLVTSVANGSTTVTATAGAVSATATLTVIQVPASVVVTPTASTFASLGDTARIAASVLDAKSVVIADATVTWGSSSATVASVDVTGLVTALANGTTSVSATLGALADTAAITVAQVPTTISVSAGDSQSAVVSTATVVAPAVRVDDARANPVPGVVVTFAVATGGGSVTSATATTDAAGLASVGSWTLGGTAGANTLTATAADPGITGNPVTFTATGVATQFDIVIRYVASTTPTPTQEAAFDNAVAFWRTVIVGDLVAIPMNVAAGNCGGVSAPAVNETVDDLLIYVAFENIDGPGGVLGSAGPCFIRTAGSLPIMGGMRFDEDDLPTLEADGDLEITIRHEMAHVLGLGTVWTDLGFLELPSDPAEGGTAGNDTFFDGPEAITAFNEVGGTDYAFNKVPVENDNATYTTGSLDGHWREGVFSTELMTPSLSSGVPNPVSKVTVQSFKDMAYVVNSAGAEMYVLPAPALALRRQGTIRLLNDVWRGPVYAVSNDGTVVRVLRR